MQLKPITYNRRDVGKFISLNKSCHFVLSTSFVCAVIAHSSCHAPWYFLFPSKPVGCYSRVLAAKSSLLRTITRLVQSRKKTFNNSIVLLEFIHTNNMTNTDVHPLYIITIYFITHGLSVKFCSALYNTWRNPL